MACSTMKTGDFDIEEIYKRDDKFGNISEENFDKYKEIVTELHSWLKKNTEKMEDSQLKQLKVKFANKYQSLANSSGVYVKKPFLVYVYRKMIEQDNLEIDSLFWSLLQKRPSRNIDGITSVTLLTSPTPTYTTEKTHSDGFVEVTTHEQKFSCKHNCYFCPNEPGQPRSYLKKEPAVARANRNEFDACRQMLDRLDSLLCCGHEIDKLEIIIEGGTYTEYPEEYLEIFHRDIIYSANTYFEKEKRKPLSISEEIEINATARVRIIGVCIETRPDAIGETKDGIPWVRKFREWGVTRVQLGIQTTNDEILKKINRGHTVEDSIRAIKILKDNCFKIDIHLMPDLPGATPEIDRKMFRDIFKTPYFQPDQLKFYPCEVTPWTMIKKWNDEGKYTPYADTNEREMIDVVKYGMLLCNPWQRLVRVIRDIPKSYIQAGNPYPNLRQMINDELEKEGTPCKCLRTRSIGRNPEYLNKRRVLRKYQYESSFGKDYYIAIESEDARAVFGFIRLRIPDSYYFTEFDCLKGMGLIRELHVYGNVVPVGYESKGDAQHSGIGKQLFREAEKIAYINNCDGVAVISGIGVTEYYRKRGCEMIDTFMVKKFLITFDKLLWITSFTIVITLFIALITK